MELPCGRQFNLDIDPNHTAGSFKKRIRSGQNIIIAYNATDSLERASILTVILPTMLKSYFRTALRSLLKRKVLSLVNILGLSVGIASFLLSYHHYRYELSYDRQYLNANSIYRIVTGDVASGNGWVKVSAPLPTKIKADVPEVQEVMRLINLNKSSKTSVSWENQTFYEQHFFLADPQVVDFFDIEVFQGDVKALEDPKSILISRSKAAQIFGFESPIDQVLSINDEHTYTVQGVFEDFPENTHLDLDFIISFQNLEKVLPGTSLDGNWGQFNYFAYALLHRDASEAEIESKIQQLNVKLSDENVFSYDEINLQPLADIHFQENRGNIKASTNIRNIWIYGLAAVAILLISIINYINLSIASSTKRIKEVGLRKTIGALQHQLILQFIGESFILVAISSLLGILTVHFFLIALINNIFDLEMVISWMDPWQWLLAASLVFGISSLAGWYIAYYIIKVEPIRALKGGIKLASGKQPVRNILLGTQFVIALTLLTSILFIRSQLDLVLNQDIGITKEGVIKIPIYEREWQKNISTIQDELENLPGISTTSATGFQPGIVNWHQTVWWEGQQADASMNIISADAQLFGTLDLELVEGGLDLLLDDDQQDLNYLLNESALEKMGWATAEGKLFSPFGPNRKKVVAGVVKDFNYKSLHHPIEPCVFVIGARFAPNNLLVKISSPNINASIQRIQQKLAELSPTVPFQYDFLDDSFNQLYFEEVRSRRIIMLYTYIAVFLCTLGLFGIISFEINERTKEMAIRQVLGSSGITIGALISAKFLKIVGVSSLIAVPLTIFLIKGWLEHFQYRVALGPGLFALAIGCILLLVLFTTAIKTFQIRHINLSQVLRQD